MAEGGGDSTWEEDVSAAVGALAEADDLTFDAIEEAFRRSSYFPVSDNSLGDLLDYLDSVLNPDHPIGHPADVWVGLALLFDPDLDIGTSPSVAIPERVKLLLDRIHTLFGPHIMRMYRIQEQGLRDWERATVDTVTLGKSSRAAIQLRIELRGGEVLELVAPPQSYVNLISLLLRNLAQFPANLIEGINEGTRKELFAAGRAARQRLEPPSSRPAQGKG